MRVLIIALWLLTSCHSTTSVMVIDDLGNGMYHCVGAHSNYSEVIELPKTTKEGDVVKIKIKK